MRRFGLGRLNLSPEAFGKMLLGDFLDAVHGYNEGEKERIEAIAELIRTSTWFLWNIQVSSADKKNYPSELWPLPWDKRQNIAIPSDERKAIEELHEKILREKDSCNGHSNKQSEG